jgi:hypothetical protein
VTQPLVDPQLQAFEEDDPSLLVNPYTLRPSEGYDFERKRRSKDEVAIEMAAAFLIVAGMIQRHLAAQQPPQDPKVVAGQAWRHHAPIWARLMVPAVKQAYELETMRGLTPEDIDHLAHAYANDLGEYMNESSGDVLLQGFQQQMSGEKFSKEIAWSRASAAYGVDSANMRGIMATMIKGGEVGANDPVTAVARIAIDKALMARSEEMGNTESHRASQMGLALSWLFQQQQGMIPIGSMRRWRTVHGEHTCEICGPMDGVMVNLDQPFELGNGQKLWAPGAHPNCECTVELVTPEGDIMSVEKAFNSSERRDSTGKWVKVGAGAAAGGAGLGAGVILHRKAKSFIAEMQEIQESTQKEDLKDALATYRIRLEDEWSTQGGHLDQWPALDTKHAALSEPGMLAGHPHAHLARVKNDSWKAPGMFGGIDDLPDARTAAWHWAAEHPRVQGIRTGVHPLSGEKMMNLSDALHAAVSNAPAEAPRLYRAVSVTPEVAAKWDVGDELEMPISSFTADGEAAARHLLLTRDQELLSGEELFKGPKQVIFHVPPGSAALDIQKWTPFPVQAEWVGGGKYEIVGRHDDGNYLHITLRQVGRLSLRLAKIAKALGDDPYDRLKDGRFASTEHRTRKVTVMERDDAVDRIMEEVRNAFGVIEGKTVEEQVKPKADLFGGGALFRAPGKDLFATPNANLFAAPKADLFADTKGIFEAKEKTDSPFDHSLNRPRGGQRKTHHVVIFTGKKRTEPPPTPKMATHYLPMDDVEDYYREEWGGATPDRGGEVVDFDDINDHFSEKDEWGRGRAVARVQPTIWDSPPDQVWDTTDQDWNDTIRQALPIWHKTQHHADSILAQLTTADLREIYWRAGYGSGGGVTMDGIRSKIADNIFDQNTPDRSLQEAYSDYVTFSRPELVGEDGQNFGYHLAAQLDKTGADFEVAPAVVFSLNQGFNDGRSELHGTYQIAHTVYHSALAEWGQDAPNGKLSIQELELEPIGKYDIPDEDFPEESFTADKHPWD